TSEADSPYFWRFCPFCSCTLWIHDGKRQKLKSNPHTIYFHWTSFYTFAFIQV
ncbi:unnamed protein product, partial [Heterosigma akashiwo]